MKAILAALLCLIIGGLLGSFIYLHYLDVLFAQACIGGGAVLTVLCILVLLFSLRFDK